MNAGFEAPGWDKVIILSPTQTERVRRAIAATSANFTSDIAIVPAETEGNGQTISAGSRFRPGASEPSKWAYQVVIQGYLTAW